MNVADRRTRTLTPGEFDEEYRIRESMRQYYEAERKWRADARRRIWRRIWWGVFILAAIVLAAWLAMSQ
jgi:hypothetical protein